MTVDYVRSGVLMYPGYRPVQLYCRQVFQYLYSCVVYILQTSIWSWYWSVFSAEAIMFPIPLLSNGLPIAMVVDPIFDRFADTSS